jgi:hypothetical protein
MNAGDQNYSRVAQSKCLSDPAVSLSVWIVRSTIGLFDQLSQDARPNLKLARIAAGAHTKPSVAKAPMPRRPHHRAQACAVVFLHLGKSERFPPSHYC